MTRPIVGVIGNSHIINNEYRTHSSATINCCALARVANCMPAIIPADPNYVSVEELLEFCDGFLFTGGRSNVHPQEYGQRATQAHGEFDRNRDAVTLPLIRSCVERGQPILALCRGFQEVNVAFGGTLHPEIREIRGRMNHRAEPEGTQEEKFKPCHEVHLEKNGLFHQILGETTVLTNSLHGQGIAVPGQRIVIEGVASDGTPEAIRIADASGFALSVQWHPEWNAEKDPVSIKLFRAFGDAVRAWRNRSGEKNNNTSYSHA